MSGWVIAALLALGAVAAVLLRLRKENARNELLMERMRASETFRRVQPMLQHCRTLRVERIVLRPECVTVTLFVPAGKTLTFDFEQQGLDSLEPLPLHTLAHLTAQELPDLADNRKYFFKAHKDTLPGGAVERWYEYMVQSAYKDAVQRAAYDRH